MKATNQMTKYNGLEITIEINKNLDAWGLDESEFNIDATMEKVGNKLSEYAKLNYLEAKVEVKITNDTGIKSVTVTCYHDDDDKDFYASGFTDLITEDIEYECEKHWGEWVVYD